MPSTATRTRALLGGALAAFLLVAGVAVWARAGDVNTTAASTASVDEAEAGVTEGAAVPEPAPAEPSTTLAPTTKP
ncbi:MAG: hypothetical protein M3203_07430, partial [Actinomycetota bacterium]|nr:hypothetical protein [Actinomycetota bacterium]